MQVLGLLVQSFFFTIKWRVIVFNIHPQILDVSLPTALPLQWWEAVLSPSLYGPDCSKAEKSGHGGKMNDNNKQAIQPRMIITNSQRYLIRWYGVKLVAFSMQRFSKPKSLHETLLKDKLNSVVFLQPLLQMHLLIVYVSYSWYYNTLYHSKPIISWLLWFAYLSNRY